MWLCGGRGMGVGGRGNFDPGNRWTKFGMEVPLAPRKVTGYVSMRWAWQVVVAWARVGVTILTRATVREIWTKSGMEIPHTLRDGYRLCCYVVGVAGGRGMDVGGRGNFDPGNRWRDLDQLSPGLLTHPREGYWLCGGRGK